MSGSIDASKSKTKTRSLLDVVGDAVFIHSIQGQILDVNDAACKRLGYSREELTQLVFFACDNILLPLNYRIIPVIKIRSNIDEEKLKKRIESHPANLFWFDSRYNRILSTLLEDFEYIIKKTIEGIDRYEEFNR